MILPREAQVVGEVAQVGWVLVGSAVPKGFRFPCPHGLVVAGPGDFPWRTQVVGVDVEDIRCCALAWVGFQHGDGQAAQPHGFLDGLPGFPVFALQLALFGIREQGGVAVDGLLGALAQGIVGVAGVEVACACAGAPALGVVTISYCAVAGLIAAWVIAVIDGLTAVGLLLQLVAAGVNSAGFCCCVVGCLTGAVAAEVVAVAQAGEGERALGVGYEPVQVVVAVGLVQCRVKVVEDARYFPGGIVTVVA